HRKGADAFTGTAQVLEVHLNNKRFGTGDMLPPADFGIGSAMILAERAHYPVEPYGEIKRWYATLRALPAWQTTLAQSAPPAEAAPRRGRGPRSNPAEPGMYLCDRASAPPTTPAH